MVRGSAAGVKCEFFCSTDSKEKVDVCAPVSEMWDSSLVGCVRSHASELRRAVKMEVSTMHIKLEMKCDEWPKWDCPHDSCRQRLAGLRPLNQADE